MAKKKKDDASPVQKSKGQLAAPVPSHPAPSATGQFDGDILHRHWMNRRDDLNDKLKNNPTLESKSYDGPIGYWMAQSLTDEPYQAIHSVARSPWEQNKTMQNYIFGLVAAAGSDTGATSGSR